MTESRARYGKGRGRERGGRLETNSREEGGKERGRAVFECVKVKLLNFGSLCCALVSLFASRDFQLQPEGA